MASVPLLSNFKALKGEALHRQITRYLRLLIQDGDLPAGSKLPRMHDLASRWNTNYFTVQTALTSLVREGLVERRPRLGTFVRKQSKELNSIGIYYGDEILSKNERAFHRSLHAQLLMLLQKENISANVFIDSRPVQQQEEPLPELLEAVQSQSIQGLIVALAGGGSTWLQNLPLPTSFFGTVKADLNRIFINSEEVIAMACEALSRQGCRTVALIHSGPNSQPTKKASKSSSIRARFEASAKKFGLQTRKAWVRVPKRSADSHEIYGYEEFQRLWSEAKKPEGLIVYPENVSRGVVIAALERQVKVPAELKLVLHKNQNVEFLCPLAADWVITQEQSVAQALIQHVKDRFLGIEPRSYEADQKFLQAEPIVSHGAIVSA